MTKAEVEVRIPVSTDEVNPDWLSSILGKKVDPSTFTVANKAQEGKGFLSNMLRVSCKKEATKEDVNVIIKLLPEASYERSILISQKLDIFEILAYKEVIPALIRQVPSLADYICPFVFGKYEDSEDCYKSVVVLQDLKPLGYATFDFGEKISESQTDQGLDFLAKFHFAGEALENSEGKRLDEVFNYFSRDTQKHMTCFMNWIRDLFPLVSKLFAVSCLSGEVKNAYKELDPFLEGSLVALMKKAMENPGMCHGDLWSNNILYNKDPSIHPKVIDWQLVALMDTELDVALFIITSLSTEDIRDDVIERMLRKYYDSYLKLCKDKNMPSHYGRNWNEFLEFFNTYGLLWVLHWFILSVAALEGKNNRRLLRVYEYLYEKGVVEFAMKIGGKK